MFISSLVNKRVDASPIWQCPSLATDHLEEGFPDCERKYTIIPYLDMHPNLQHFRQTNLVCQCQKNVGFLVRISCERIDFPTGIWVHGSTEGHRESPRSHTLTILHDLCDFLLHDFSSTLAYSDLHKELTICNSSIEGKISRLPPWIPGFPVDLPLHGVPKTMAWHAGKAVQQLLHQARLRGAQMSVMLPLKKYLERTYT